MNYYNNTRFEGAAHYCVDCRKEIGNGVRCNECVEKNRCEYCDAGGFHTDADRQNHYWHGHCAECHEPHEREEMHHVVPREDERFDIERFECVDGREMGGGYLCDGCLAELTVDDDEEPEAEPEPESDPERVEAKKLFEQVDEGDKLLFGDRSEPVTVYRHVTEDDRDGQVITMAEVTEDWEESLNYDRQGEHPKAAKAVVGDLVEGELTGKEFFVVRGPRDGAYVLAQKWSKYGGRWTAQVSLFRRTRKPRRVWGWERYADDLTIVGHEDVDRDEFDVGNGPWVRHTDVEGRAMWSDTLLGEVSQYDETDAGEEVTVPSEVLEGVSVGDVVSINDLPDATVTDVTVYDGDAIADGVMLDLDVDGTSMRARTISKGFKASVFGRDYPHEKVESAEVVR